MIGSAMNAATVSAPSRRIASSSSRAAAWPTVSPARAPWNRYGYGAWMWRKPGTRGSNIFQKGAMPVALIAWRVTPWYAFWRAMTLTLFGLPLAFQ